MRDELEALTPEAFSALPEAKRLELIEYNDEFVRTWRGVCQLCRASLSGTRAQLRAHRCGDGPAE